MSATIDDVAHDSDSQAVYVWPWFSAQQFICMIKDNSGVPPLLKYSLKLAASKVEPELTRRTGLSSRLPAANSRSVSFQTVCYFMHLHLVIIAAQMLFRSKGGFCRTTMGARGTAHVHGQPVMGALPVRGQKKLGSALILRFVQLSRKPSTSVCLQRAGKPIFDMTVIVKYADAPPLSY